MHLRLAQRYRASRQLAAPVWPGHSANDGGGTGQFIDPDLGDRLSAITFLTENIASKVDAARDQHTRYTKLPVSSCLLFGPPGVSKTTVAQSLARRLQWEYVEVNPATFVIHGLERIEERASRVFSDLGNLRNAVVLLDELDSLLLDRDRLHDGTMTMYVVPGMLPKLQRLARNGKTNNLLIIIATNFYDRIDAAAVRLGRVDALIPVLPANSRARHEHFATRLKKTFVNSVPAPLLEFLTAESKLYTYEELERTVASVELHHVDWESWSKRQGVMPPPSISPKSVLVTVAGQGCGSKDERGNVSFGD